MSKPRTLDGGRSFTLYLDAHSIAALRQIAAQRKTSMSRTMRDLIREKAKQDERVLADSPVYQPSDSLPELDQILSSPCRIAPDEPQTALDCVQDLRAEEM